MGDTVSRAIAVGALLVLFAAQLVMHALLPLDPMRFAVTYGIAGLQVAVVAIGFMRLAESPLLARLAAIATMIWLIILFAFMSIDYLHR